MEKLSMCRICLSGDGGLRSIANTDLEEAFEALTSLMFDTEDLRPVLVCYICRARLRHCYDLRKSCLQSEELFTMMMECNTSTPAELLGNVREDRFVISRPMMHLSVGHADTGAEAPAVWGELAVKLENDEASKTECLQVTIDDAKLPADSDDQLLAVNEKTQAANTSSVDITERTGPAFDADAAHAEDEVILEDVKEEPDNVTGGTPRLAAQTYRKDTLLNNVTRIDPTMESIDEPKTEKDVKIKSIKKKKIEGTRDNTDTKLHNDKHNNSTSDQNDAHKEMSQNKISADQSVNNISNNKLKQFLCGTCQKCFRRNWELLRHTRTHTGEKPYECNICNKCFNRKSNLDKHIGTHTGVKPYQCNLCDKCFYRKDNLDRHKRKHTVEKPYQCHVCKKCFNQKSHLDVHVRTHTGEKPYQCNICNRSFIEKGKLDIHTRTHTGEKPYQCKICNKCFKQKGGLSVHIRTHTGEKPYQCHLCKKCFVEKSKLVNHIRTHTGGKFV